MQICRLFAPIFCKFLHFFVILRQCIESVLSLFSACFVELFTNVNYHEKEFLAAARRDCYDEITILILHRVQSVPLAADTDTSVRPLPQTRVQQVGQTADAECGAATPGGHRAADRC